MTSPPFFTNGVEAAKALTGDERLPADLLVDDSGSSFFITPRQIGLFALEELDLPNGQYGEDASTVSFVAAGAAVAGAKLVVLELSGTLGGDETLTMPSATDIAAAAPRLLPGENYVLRFVNTSSAAHKWTIAAAVDGSVSVAGTVDVLQSTWREFLATFNEALTVLALQNIGAGTK